MPFRRIPSGKFLMGSRGYATDEEPRHLVRITRPFYVGTCPVTQRQFAVWTTECRIGHENHFKDRPNHPAENMDWHQAVDFCRWLNKARRSELPPGYLAGLPTEAEWEYASRARSETEYSSGDGKAALREVAWFGEELDDGSTHESATKPANAYGLHDMHGNVWEWCWDEYDAAAYAKRPDGVSDPADEERPAAFVSENGTAEDLVEQQAQQGNPDRVVRGGSWGNTARWCRSACRNWGSPRYRGWLRGFRVCLVPGPDRAKKSSKSGLEMERGGTPRGVGRPGGGEPDDVDLRTVHFPPRRGRESAS